MKRNFVLFLLLSASFICFSQNIRIFDSASLKNPQPIDTLLFTVQYETSMVQDVKKPENIEKETMMLRIGKKLSEYYSYTTFIADSVLSADFAAGASQQTVSEHLSQYGMGSVSYKIYKNYPEGKLTLLDRIVTDNFLVEEPMPVIDWKITPDTATVCGYLCKKAVANFRGRDYEAWFTPEIARNDGPWKLQGLPGLILKAQDTQKHYQFVCTGIEKSKKPTTINYPQTDRRKVIREELATLYRRFNADPQGYIISNNPNVKLTVRDKAGNEIKKMSNPYNPIELK